MPLSSLLFPSALSRCPRASHPISVAHSQHRTETCVRTPLTVHGAPLLWPHLHARRAVDEDIYNRKFETRDVGVQDRYLDKTARKKELTYNVVDYMCRFDQKYSEMNGSYDRYARAPANCAVRPKAPRDTMGVI